MSPPRIFLLSPANCNGTRAKQILSPKAQFSLAVELRSRRGAMLGDVFAFVSGLYFRGKLTYAVRFAGFDGVHVITPNAGLRRPDTYITHKALRTFADGDIHHHNADYRRPLEKSARALLDEIGPDCDVVLLGSVAAPEYVGGGTGVFGERLEIPIDFGGRGGMGRGGLARRTGRGGVGAPV